MSLLKGCVSCYLIQDLKIHLQFLDKTQWEYYNAWKDLAECSSWILFFFLHQVVLLWWWTARKRQQRAILLCHMHKGNEMELSQARNHLEKRGELEFLTSECPLPRLRASYKDREQRTKYGPIRDGRGWRSLMLFLISCSQATKVLSVLTSAITPLEGREDWIFQLSIGWKREKEVLIQFHSVPKGDQHF